MMIKQAYRYTPLGSLNVFKNLNNIKSDNCVDSEANIVKLNNLSDISVSYSLKNRVNIVMSYILNYQ